ncbi:MAG: lytic transglycosylase domain-containing protein [Rhizobacter sp.]
MHGRTQVRRGRRARRLVATGFALAACATGAAAQLCAGALPVPGAASAPASGLAKFQLITNQCPSLAAAAPAHRADQLALYDKAAPVAIQLDGTGVPAAVAEPVPPAPTAPLGPDGARVLSLAPALSAAAREHGIDPLLLHAIAHVESRHRASAVSPAGARGVMQVMPATAQRFGVGDAGALFDASTNVRAAAAYLRTLRTRYGDDLRLVLAAYNAGEGAVDKAGRNVPPYPETQAYVRDVLALYRRLSTSFSVSPSGALVARGAGSLS